MSGTRVKDITQDNGSSDNGRAKARRDETRGRNLYAAPGDLDRLTVKKQVTGDNVTTAQLAARWDVAALVDAGVYMDAETTSDCRLHDRVAYPKRGAVEPLLLWQIVGEKVDKGGDADKSGEWMYQLAAFEANPWDAYNQAVLLWIGGHAADARKRAGSAIATAAPDVREALEALQARITNSPMPTIMLEEVVAAQGSNPGATPETRPMTAAGILDEYHIAEKKFAQARGEAWEKQRQRVADKVREKRQAKADGDAPCNAAAPSTANVTRVTLVPASSADAGIENASRQPREDGKGIPVRPGCAIGMLDAFAQLAAEREQAEDEHEHKPHGPPVPDDAGLDVMRYSNGSGKRLGGTGTGRNWGGRPARKLA
eukprot:gene14512-biopygen10897